MISKVVAKKKDGTLIKGTTGDFMPSKKIFHVYGGRHAAGDVAEVIVNDLKAVFFVKKLEGDISLHSKPRKAEELKRTAIGKQIRVTFYDDEIIEGFSHSLHLDRQGFFMIPLDILSNNERIFVVLSSVKSVFVKERVLTFSTWSKSEITCLKCGNKLENNWKFCPFDGTKIKQGQRGCTYFETYLQD